MTTRALFTFAAVTVALAVGILWFAGDVDAGGIEGRIERRVARASLGGGMSLGALHAALDPSEPAGPVLIYVAESVGPLPVRRVTPPRVRITAGGMSPMLVATVLGTEVEFQNADSSAHRVVGRSDRDAFDVGWQAGGTASAWTAKQLGVYRLQCAIERSRLGEIVVLSHSAFTLTDAGGGFSLPDLPPGRVTLVAYSARHGEISREVKVPESGTIEVDLSF